MKRTNLVLIAIGALAATSLVTACGGGGGGGSSSATASANKQTPTTTTTSGGTTTPTKPGSTMNPCPQAGGCTGPIRPIDPPIPTPIKPLPGPVPVPQPSNLPIPIRPQPGPIHICPDAGGCTGPISPSTSSATSIGQGTSDVNLQRGMAANANLDARAEAVATQFQMNFDSARQLTALADRMNLLEQQGQLTADDREALARSALAVAGLREKDVTDAIQAAANGDKNAIENVMLRGAKALDMPSTAMLKTQILPSLGVLVP